MGPRRTSPGGPCRNERGEGPRPGGDRGAAARRGMEPQGRGQEAPDVRFAEGGLRRVRGVAVREGHARAGALRQRVRDGGLPEDPPTLRRLPDAPELPDQEGGGGVTQRERGYYWATNDEDPEPQPVYVDYDG